MTDADLLERLAVLEHEQWVHWARALIEGGDVPLAQATRWRALFVPYAELPEAAKELDRGWARRVLALIRDAEMA